MNIKMDAYIGDSVLYDKNIFSGYNIAVPVAHMTEREMMFVGLTED